MTPRGLMAMGAVVLVLALTGATIWPETFNAILVAAGGMLFGKGYGIWEERARRPIAPTASKGDTKA